MNVLGWQWVLVIGSSIALFLLAPWSKTPREFFRAQISDQGKPGFWLLTGSLVISWIFAKSITNAANLGLSYGFVGGLSYAGYYLSFVVAGLVIYALRTKGKFESIHHFLQQRFGRSAVVIFSLLIGFRLFNEVWSNTMVIGTYFGEKGSVGYYAAILVFTGLTLAYALKGGLRSSLLTDLIQFCLFGFLLILILGILIPDSGQSLGGFVSEGDWGAEGGIWLLVTAVIQSLSYPFHDPVMTDRGFISSPRVTLKSFLWAALIGGILILLFSFVGIYARFEGMEGQAAVEVGRSLGILLMLPLNFIMVTSAASTVDSTLASFSKLGALDLGKKENATVSKGRWLMVGIAALGTLPVFLGPQILSATTVSGTMVIGLAPVFLFWWVKANRWAFLLPVFGGILVGAFFALDWVPDWLIWFNGPYGDLLSVNLWGTGLVFLLYGAGLLLNARSNEQDEQ